MTELFRASAHVRLHRGRVFVVKVGGSSLAKPASIAAVARQIAVVEALGARVVVVHGGGPQTDAIERILGAEPRRIDGRRVTSETSLRALRFATVGETNGDLAGAIAAEGAPAVGFGAGAGGVLVAARRPPVPTSEGVVDFGLVGDVWSAEVAPIRALLAAGFVPVVCPPASDGAGGFLNVNADVAAAAIAVALQAAKLVILTSAPGVLRDPQDPSSLVSALSLDELDAFDREGALRDGMKVKAAAIRAALRGGVERVHVVSGTDSEALLRELYTNHGAGTLVTLEPEVAPPAAGPDLSPATTAPSPAAAIPIVHAGAIA